MNEVTSIGNFMPHEHTPIICTRCNREVMPKDVRWLFKNKRTGAYSDNPRETVGPYPFDAECARLQLLSESLFGTGKKEN